MVAQIKHLTLLQLRNLFGINTYLHTKDTKAKKTATALMVVYALLFLMMGSYVCGLVYGYVYLGLGAIVPTYLVFICSLVVFAFGIFKAGAVIFGKSSYEILSSLPVTKTAIVSSRFLRMYIENVLLCLLVMIPGMVTYGILCKANALFYVLGLVNVFIAPLLPMALATLFGAVVTWISSRMKHKSLVSGLLSIIFVVVVMSFSTNLEKMETATMEQLSQLADTFTKLIDSVYPMANLLGGAMVGGGFVAFLFGVLISVAAVAAVIVTVSVSLHNVMQRLHGTSAKHDYRMEQMSSSHMLSAMVKKEFKRYFASSIYLTNTIMGPVLGAALGIALLFVSVDGIMAELPALPLSPNFLIAAALSGTISMMPVTCVSLSMEGKSWWIIKSLPISSKLLFDAKVLMYLLLVLPFYVVSVICTIIGLQANLGESLVIMVMPISFVLLTAVFGIRANLWFHSFDWTDEVKIVKQSTPAAVGGFAGVICMFLTMAVAVVTSLLFPGKGNVLVGVLLTLCGILLAIAYGIYQANNRTELP